MMKYLIIMLTFSNENANIMEIDQKFLQGICKQILREINVVLLSVNVLWPQSSHQILRQPLGRMNISGKAGTEVQRSWHSKRKN